MGRIGFVHHDDLDATEEILNLQTLRNLKMEGMFTHYAVADEMSEESLLYTDRQSRAFDDLVEKLEAKGVHLPVLHTKNSAAISNLARAEHQLVRAGIILYGIAPSDEVAGYDLKPVMELKSVVSMVKRIPAGTSVSYGRRFISEKEMKIATVPIGYADGFFRCFSNRGELLIRGKRARILGSVCMDQLMVDVTEIPGVKLGDVVTILGRMEKRAFRCAIGQSWRTQFLMKFCALSATGFPVSMTGMGKQLVRQIICTADGADK